MQFVHAQATHTAQDWAQAPAEFAPQDSLRDYLTRLRAALLASKDRPAQQEPLKLTATSTAESRSGVRRLRIRDFQLLSDGARAVAEYNLAAGSWPTVVGVIGSAVANDFLLQAALKGIPLDELEVVITSRVGTAPSSTTGTRVTYPRNFVYTAHIVSPASDAELEELRRTVERVSPVLNLVGQPQAIEHGKLFYTQTAARREGRTLEGLREFLAEKRLANQGAKPPDSPSRFAAAVPRNADPLRAHIKVEGGTGIRHIRTDVSNFQILHDNPRSLAGHNLGPVAEEHILGVMITCLTHIYEMQAASRGVVLDSLELEVEGTLMPRIGSTATPPRYGDIRYSVHIGSPEKKEIIEQLQQAVEAICPIYNMLKDPQEIKGSVVRGPPGR
ncbi:MAG TPA: OsmC family protein [Opitutaceae bacterium]|nr:OsmC family protein [Opitutaceae bacterium]